MKNYFNFFLKECILKNSIYLAQEHTNYKMENQVKYQKYHLFLYLKLIQTIIYQMVRPKNYTKNIFK